MTWLSRVTIAYYISPVTKSRIEFSYEDISRSVDRHTVGFDFPDADGTVVQQLGRSGRKYPVKAFFSGSNHDQLAANFESALLEPGVGKLSLPFYKTIDVVPFGSITRRDPLKTASNQSIVNVTFWETLGTTYPIVQEDPAAVSKQAVTDHAIALGVMLRELRVDQIAAQNRTENFYTALLNITASVLSGIAERQADVDREFEQIQQSINRGIDGLIGDPITLALQTAQLIQAPSRVNTSVAARLEGYARMADAIISRGSPADPLPERNEFLLQDAFVQLYVTGSVLSVINNQFETKSGALEAADELLRQFDAAVAWRDSTYEPSDLIDTGETYQTLLEAVSMAAGYLVEISFTLKQEKRVILNRKRTIVDLTAELYGNIDEDLDFLIESNNLTGSEILELQEGREIVFYV